MRSKVIAGVMIFGTVVLAIIFLFGPQNRKRTTSGSEEAEAIFKDSRKISMPLASKFGVPSNPTPSTYSLSGTNQEAIDERVNRLMELGSSGDKAGLKEIQANLNNQFPEIRQIARESAIIFGDKSSIPLLQDQLALTEDLSERKEISDAIEALNLPPIAEVLARVATNASSKPRIAVQDGEKFPQQIKREARMALEEQKRLKSQQQPQPSSKPEAPPRSAPTTP